MNANPNLKNIEDCLGDPPRLTSFAATIAISRVYSDNLKNWFGNAPLIPAFAIYSGETHYSYFRSNGCHDLLPPIAPGMPILIHMALGQYDFGIHIMSLETLGVSHFYEYYPAIVSFSQAYKNEAPPRGNQGCNIDGKFYLRLFHHTTEEGKSGILTDRCLKGSSWNFCGTRKLGVRHCYLTDMPKAGWALETLPMLIRQSNDEDIIFRTDDGIHIKKSGVQVSVENKQLTTRLSFLVLLDVIQQNPMVFHHQIEESPKWLEIMFPSIYRCPCSGLALEKSTIFENEEHWIIDKNSPIDFRTEDPIACADGNDIQALLALIDDYFIPPDR